MPSRNSRPLHLRHLLLHVLWLFALLFVVATASARTESPPDRLITAIDIYQHGGYLEAAAILTNLLYPLKLADRKAIVQAKVYLGICYYVLGRRDEAEDEFRGIFKIDPGYQPDPLIIPDEVIAFIERVRPPPTLSPPTMGKAPLLGLGEKPVTTDIKPLTSSPINLLPLGIPQFWHGDTGRGVGLATAEVLLLGLNAGSYWYLKIYNDSSGLGQQSNYNYLIAAKTLNITSLSLLAVTLAYGMGDALYRYRPNRSMVSLHFSVLPGPNPEASIGLHGRF